MVYQIRGLVFDGFAKFDAHALRCFDVETYHLPERESISHFTERESAPLIYRERGPLLHIETGREMERDRERGREMKSGREIERDGERDGETEREIDRVWSR